MILAAKLSEIKKAKIKVWVKLRDLENVDLVNYKHKCKELDHLFDNVSDLVYNLLNDPLDGFDEQETVQPYNALLHRVVQTQVDVKDKMAALKELDEQKKAEVVIKERF